MKGTAELLRFPTLHAEEPAAAERRVVQLEDGAVAELDGAEWPHALRIFTREGNLLFEYDARSGKARASAAGGDIEVAAGGGDLVLRAERRVRLEGESIEVSGRKEVRLGIEASAEPSGAELSLKRDAVELAAARLGVMAGSGDLRLGETQLLSERLRGCVGDAILRFGRIETLANTVIQRARDVYAVVKGLSQLKAGRWRTLVKGTWRAKSRDAIVTAERDVMVDGENIHLG